MKRMVLLLALLAVAVVASSAMARPPYRVQAIKQLQLAADAGDVRTVTCQYCHVNPGGGAPWNVWGENVRSNFKGNISEALFEAVKAMKDSDGDGYEDALEIFAGTLPGDPASKPNKDKAALKASFDKAGGVDMFKAQ